MATNKFNEYSCLICASIITSEKTKQVTKLDSLFLLQTLLEISQENKLLKNIINSLNSIQICNKCISEVEQCKQIYSEICEKIEKFWECQNKILEKFPQNPNCPKSKNDNSNDWVFQCRKFVRDHDFSGFGYPFTVHDLETLLISIPASPPHQLQDEINCEAKNELSVNMPENDDMSKDPFEETPSLFSQPSEQDIKSTVKQEPESEPEDETADVRDDDDYNPTDDNVDQSDNDSDYETSPPPKKPKINPSKRKSTKQDNQIKKRRTRKLSEFYPNFQRDPTTRKFHCPWSAGCGQQFVDKKGLEPHWDRHQGTPRQICEECSQAFYSRRELACHRDKEHPKEGDKFDCKKCGKSYQTRESFLAHLRTHQDEKREERRKTRLKKLEEDPIKRDPVSKKWKCWWPDCEKMYLDRCDLNFHIDRHKGTPQQKCGECGALFYSRCQLVAHKESKHEKGKKFDCEICGDKFETSRKLYAHKTYRHSESGTGVEVVCQICGKSYKKPALYLHMRYVHGSKEEKKFACHLCPETFVSLPILKRHLWGIHKFWESEEDNEKFAKLKEKEKARGKKWSCHVKGCRVRFATEEGLKKHVDGAHKGKWGEGEEMERKFKCSVCGKGFHIRQKLTRHEKQHERN